MAVELDDRVAVGGAVAHCGVRDADLVGRSEPPAPGSGRIDPLVVRLWAVEARFGAVEPIFLSMGVSGHRQRMGPIAQDLKQRSAFANGKRRAR